MEEGSFRCDANVSVRAVGTTEYGTRTELKNMNSFKNVERALAYEVHRQKAIIKDEGAVAQETRLWDSDKGVTVSMRGKEEAHDYRYFPDPDLVPLVIDEAWIASVKEGLPELPEEKKERFINAYDLPPYDADVLTTSRELADYFEACVKRFAQPKQVSNWIMGPLFSVLKAQEKEIGESPITSEGLAELLQLIDTGTISGKIAKTVFEEMVRTGKPAKQIVEAKGLVQVTDMGAIKEVVEKILSQFSKEVADYKGGKKKLFGFFVGQVMKATRGKANPQVVNEILKKILDS
jgi:aspartyl-tRNA(Asn)/glutamyl-tRNA(Gln) amidotransferase subunit B